MTDLAGWTAEEVTPTQAAGLAADLARQVAGTVRFDAVTRALYSTDASNYRHVPIGVVQPVSIDDVVAALAVCRAHGVPVLPRGAATSIAGQACNVAVVLDLARHLDEPPVVDAATSTAHVQPGVVLDDLRRQAAGQGLTFGPDPSTHSRCTLGGMIGNNACGSHSLVWGKTVDNVESLDVVLYDGTRLTVGPTSDAALAELCRRGDATGRLYRALRDVASTYADVLRSSFPRLSRRVSGYNLDQLLPEHGFDVARALVGSEGTCAVVLGATVRLVRPPRATALAVLGYPDIYSAAERVPELLEHRPATVEGIDAELVAAFAARNPRSGLPASLPTGRGWLLVETVGETAEEAEDAAYALVEAMAQSGVHSEVSIDPRRVGALWRLREEGAGIATRLASGGEAWPGWEDAAVPPERLGAYLRQFRTLMANTGTRGILYGHFGEGCVHARLDFDLATAEGVGRFRQFVTSAADIVVLHGGSFSGEHGDGQARSELLPKLFPRPVLDAFAAFKAAFDPHGMMNPGRVVAPRPLDADLRIRSAPPRLPTASRLALTADRGDLAAATRRCMGVGKCLNASGGVMCPSYRATREERHSTRGRSRLLFEMLNGGVVRGGWRSAQVLEALDLCLGCKGCKVECPVNVDMATYKVEFLDRHYAGRVRPASHYSMGYLPRWLRLGARVPALVNLVASSRLAGAVKLVAGIAPERSLPHLAPETLQRASRRHSGPLGRGYLVGGRGQVLLWPDTFTNHFDPEIGLDAIAVLESLGYSVELPDRAVCCGLTWLATGQIERARRVLRRSLDTLQPWLAAGVPIVGLEPSCTALFRSDALQLLPDHPAARAAAAGFRTFAEVVAAAQPEWEPPTERLRALAQVHCHQHAELGFGADRRVLESLGVELEVLDAGCCGMAGSFGFERDHYDVSVRCADAGLLSAVRVADPAVTVLADGFSCRTQIRQLTSRQPVHLASLVARLLERRGSAPSPAVVRPPDASAGTPGSSLPAAPSGPPRRHDDEG